MDGFSTHISMVIDLDASGHEKLDHESIDKIPVHCSRSEEEFQAPEKHAPDSPTPFKELDGSRKTGGGLSSGAFQLAGWEGTCFDTEPGPLVKLRDERMEVLPDRIDQGLLHVIGALFNFRPQMIPRQGQRAIFNVAFFLQLLRRGGDCLRAPAACGCVGAQRHPNIKLRQYIHLQRIEASREIRGDMAIAPVFSNEVAGPPELTVGILRPGTCLESREHGSSRPIGNSQPTA